MFLGSIFTLNSLAKFMLLKLKPFIFLFLLATPLLSTAEQMQFNYDVRPAAAWVEQHSYPEGDPYSEYESQYLLVDDQVYISESNEKHYFYRYAFRLNQVSAVENSSNISVQFAADYQSLMFHTINIIRDGKVIKQLDKSKLKVNSVENEKASNIYSGTAEATFFLEGVRVGDIVDYSFTIEGDNPVFAGSLSYFARFAWSIPVEKRYFSLWMPKGRKVSSKAFNSELTVRTVTKETHTGYLVEASNTPEITEEDALPSWYDAYHYIQFSEYESWSQVSGWANTLFDIEEVLSPELSAFIQELKGLEKEEAIARAINFAQDEVRYLGLEIAENSHKPHHPNSVMKNRYGDCKDKSLLLSTLLNAIDVDAWPALVSTRDRHRTAKYLPTHSAFDHAIVHFNWNAKSYWIDPTRTYQGKALGTVYQPDYGKALLIKPQQTELVDTNVTVEIGRNTQVRESLYAMDYFSPVEWRIKTSYSGLEAERRRANLASTGKRKLAKQYLDYYSKYYPRIKALKKMEVVDDKENNRLTISEFYLIPDFWKIDDGAAYFELYTDVVAEYLVSPKSIQRTQPLALTPKVVIDHQINFYLPEDVDFSDSIATTLIEDEYFRLESRFRYEPRKLILNNRYVSKADEIPVADVTAHLDKLKKARERMSYSNSITNVELSPGIEERKEWLKAFQRKEMNYQAASEGRK